MGNQKFSKNSKADAEKLYNIQGQSLVGNLEASKDSVKITVFC